jgi:phosphoribosylglycinamide formyltransferase-1
VHEALRPVEHALLPEAVRLIARGAVSPDPENPRRTLVTADEAPVQAPHA